MIVDTWYRHLLKTGSWRIVAFTILGIISYLVTGSLALAGAIAGLDWIIKSILYFLHEYAWSKSNIGRRLTERKGCVVWLTGLSGSGKTTIADRVAEKLRARLIPVARLDGDIARRTFSSDLGFSSEDRAENCRRAAIVSSYLKENHIVLASFISPKKAMRDYVLDLCGDKETIIVHVNAPIDECARRDPKGMYAQLEDGKFKGNPFTGMHPDAPYEEPKLRNWSFMGFGEADLKLETQSLSIDECADKIILWLKVRGFVK